MTTPTTLPARYYVDEDNFRNEMETFFAEMWVCAGRTEQLSKPGDFFVCELASESVIVTRDSDGAWRAFYNVCRHRGTRICGGQEGTFAGRIQCPYHGWTYGLDGQLIGAPHMDIDGFQRQDYPLHAVHIAEWDGNIFLNLKENPEPLDAQLADLPRKMKPWNMQGLRLHKRMVYEAEANWKLIISNYNECLHCPILHPSLNRITDYLSGENDLPTGAYIGGTMNFRGGAETMSVDGKRRREFLPGLSDVQRQLVLYYTVYPNFLVSLHPDYVMLHRVWPRAVDRTQIVCDWLFDPKEMSKPGFNADDVLEFWDATNREDWGISELSQKGIRSRAYVPGPYSPNEGLPRAFDLFVLEHERKNGAG